MKHVLLTYGNDSKQIIISLNAYKLWLKRCERVEFESHQVIYIEQDLVNLLKEVLND